MNYMPVEYGLYGDTVRLAVLFVLNGRVPLRAKNKCKNLERKVRKGSARYAKEYKGKCRGLSTASSRWSCDDFGRNDVVGSEKFFESFYRKDLALEDTAKIRGHAV